MLKNKKKVKKLLLKENVQYVIYCRKSRDESSEGQKQSLLDQLQSCLNEAKRKGLKLAQKSDITDQYFRDDQYFRWLAECQSPHEKNITEKADGIFYIIEQGTAKEPNKRPLRTQLIKLVKQGKINGILSYAPDRHARNLVESGELIQLLNEYRLDVQYTNFSFENNENGRMILGINFVISYNYSDNLSKVTTRGKKGVIERGQADGKYKYGYIINDQKYHEPDKEFFNIWKEAFRRKVYENQSDEEIWRYIISSGFKRKYRKNNKTTELNKNSLYRIWLDPFYYGILISGNNEIDLRDGSNPYYERLITEEEHRILLDRHLKRNPISLKTYKPKDENEEIMPFPNKFILFEGQHGLTFNLPNKNRFIKKLTKNRSLKDVVNPHQFCYKNDKVKVDGKQISFDGQTLINSVYNYLSSHFSVNESNYEKYRNFQLIEYDKIMKQLNEERRAIQHQINQITSMRDTLVRNYISNGSLERNELQNKIYNQEVTTYNEKISYLEDEIKNLGITQRNTVLEFDGFVQYLNKLAKAYDKGSYVRKRKITTLLFSNVIVTKEKQLIFKAKPGLEDLFIEFNQGGETRTHDHKTPSLVF